MNWKPIKEIFKHNQILFLIFTFILMIVLSSGNSYATPNIRTVVCDLTITGKVQAEYEGVLLQCMDYSYWNKDCNEIYNRTKFFGEQGTEKVTFTYLPSNLQVNKTYRITANVFLNWGDIQIVDDNRDLLIVTKSLCQEGNRKEAMEAFTNALPLITVVIIATILILFKLKQKPREFFKPNLIKIAIVIVLVFASMVYSYIIGVYTPTTVSEKIAYYILISPSGIFNPVAYYVNLGNYNILLVLLTLIAYLYTLSCLIVWIYDKAKKPRRK